MHQLSVRRLVALILVLATSASATAQQGTPPSSGTAGTGTGAASRSMTLLDERAPTTQRSAVRRLQGTGRRTSVVRLDDGQTGQTALARAELAAVTAGGAAAVNAIIGTARDAGDNLLPDVALQLRDLRNGAVVARTQTTSSGQFAFQSLESGTYAVEMVTVEGIVALSDAVTIASGEIVQTVVQLAARTRSFAFSLGNAAASAVNSAVSAGVLAVDPGPPVSPEG